MTEDETQKFIDRRLASEAGLISFDPLNVRMRKLSIELSEGVGAVVVVMFVNGFFTGYALPTIVRGGRP